MRGGMAAIVLAGMLAGCGGDGGGDGGGIAVVPSTPAPAPSASPSPAAPVYPTFAQPAGDQLFRTACGVLELNASPPFPRTVLAIGEGPVIRYTAATDRYAIDGDAISATFGPEDRDPAAPAGARAYVKRIDGIPQVFSTGQPIAGGVGLDYARGMNLQIQREGRGINRYACTFGVPTLPTDRPAAAFAYARTGLNGIAYTVEQPGGLRTYTLAASTVTMRVDPAAGQATIAIRLTGQLLGPGGPAATTTDFGNFTGTVAIDPVSGGYRGSLTGPDGRGDFSGLAGSFYGPQAREAAFSFALVTADAATGLRLSAVGNGSGVQ